MITVRRYVRKIRPARGRIYQEVVYEPGQAMQVDWGNCGQIKIENTSRKVSVLVAVLCYSRLCYIEFMLSQRKAEFYRAIVHAVEFFEGRPRRIIFDNLRAAVVNGSGRNACLHPEFLALCGHFCLEPIACARRDPESKGIVEAGVRYVKYNALQGRAEQLTTWRDYQELAVRWRDEVANVRMHHLRRLLNLVRLYGRSEVLAAIARAHQYQTYDAAYVETILLQERRRQELPSPTPLRPKRQELIDEIDFEEPDPAIYDRLLGTDEQEQEENDQT